MMYRTITKRISSKNKRSVKRFFKTIVQSIAYNVFYKKSFSNKNGIKSIVFICSGNICRSVFAEYYLKSISKNIDLIIRSCGVDVIPGKEGKTPEKTIRIAKEFNVDIPDHKSKVIGKYEYNSDLIVALEFEHYKKIIHRYPQCKNDLFLMTDFQRFPKRLFCNIYDPYGLDDRQYRKAFKKVKKCVTFLSCKILQKSESSPN